MIPILQQIAAAEREAGLRKRVYPRWVEAKKMTQDKARHEIDAMDSIYGSLRAMPLLTSACEELLHYARSAGADAEMLDRCSAALKVAGARI